VSLTGDDRLQRDFSYEWASGAVVPVISVVLAVVVGGLVVLVTGHNPVNAYWQLLLGAFGSRYSISETIIAAIPLMLAGLAVAFAFRAGLFNIGAEGQIFVGALLSAYVGYKVNAPGIVLIPLALGAGALAGGLWGALAGVLKAWRGAHEVITTMMLNYTAIALSQYLLESSPSGKPGPMAQTFQPGNPETPPMNTQLPIIIPDSLVHNGRLHAGLFVALAAGGLFYFILWRTSLGYKIRAVGLNQKAAAYAGINVGWTISISMFIAGAFAGLAGMVSTFGLAPYQLTDSFSPGYGFDAIAVALLGKNTVLGVIAASVLFGAFEYGGGIMQANTGISSRLIVILQGLVILFIGADALVRYLAQRGVVRLPRWQRQEVAA